GAQTRRRIAVQADRTLSVHRAGGRAGERRAAGRCLWRAVRAHQKPDANVRRELAETGAAGRSLPAVGTELHRGSAVPRVRGAVGVAVAVRRTLLRRIEVAERRGSGAVCVGDAIAALAVRRVAVQAAAAVGVGRAGDAAVAGDVALGRRAEAIVGGCAGHAGAARTARAARPARAARAARAAPPAPPAPPPRPGPPRASTAGGTPIGTARRQHERQSEHPSHHGGPPHGSTPVGQYAASKAPCSRSVRNIASNVPVRFRMGLIAVAVMVAESASGLRVSRRYATTPSPGTWNVRAAASLSPISSTWLTPMVLSQFKSEVGGQSRGAPRRKGMRGGEPAAGLPIQ